jgi:hypothetical protein
MPMWPISVAKCARTLYSCDFANKEFPIISAIFSF